MQQYTVQRYGSFVTNSEDKQAAFGCPQSFGEQGDKLLEEHQSPDAV